MPVAAPTVTSSLVIDGGHDLAGLTGRSHNAVLARTRRLLAGQGYRVNRERSRVGHLELVNGAGNVAIIDVVTERPEAA